MGMRRPRKRRMALVSNLLSICLLIFGTAAAFSVNTLTVQNSDAIPASWPISAPEEQGMDSARLAAMLKQIQADERNIHSILIARHGILVLEAYFHPFNRETPHNLYSCTKSVTSALTGIAIDRGLVTSVDTTVHTLFPDVSVDTPDKEAITLRHLLTMSSGIEWTEPLRSGLSDTWSFIESDSPPQYFFDRTLIHAPGKIFNYNTGGSHLLSMILQNASGEMTAEFARQNLFDPLGISEYVWDKDMHGYTTGGTGLALRPDDMLRIGQLYLQNGKWGGNQVIPEAWVRESTTAKITVSPGIDYGYQWWVHQDGIYNALGWGGQQIIVIPQQDLVVVINAGLRDAAWNSYNDLLYNFILPSVRSSRKLPVNTSEHMRLKSEVEKIAAPEPVQPAPSPRIVTSINDREYVDLNGTHGWSIFTFHFDGSNVARLELDYGEKSENINALIGLDGIYRITKTINYGPVALKGYWKNENTFVLFQQFLREAERLTMTLTFSETGINRHTEWLVENHSEDSEAVFLNR